MHHETSGLAFQNSVSVAPKHDVDQTQECLISGKITDVAGKGKVTYGAAQPTSIRIHDATTTQPAATRARVELSNQTPSNQACVGKVVDVIHVRSNNIGSF